MSEYQYYEFRAIDRPLTDRQMRELRAISSRAAISRTSSHVVVTMSVEREDFDGADDGTSWLSSVVGLRGDIASGDERPLYLAWLLGVQLGQVDDEAAEPARPDGLGDLSPSLASFVDIMGLDRNLVAAAAEGGARATAPLAARDIDRWLAGLGSDEHVALLSRVARGDGSVGAEITRRYRQCACPQPSCLPLRTCSTLRERAGAMAEVRRQVARQREAQARARREREEQAARDRYLTSLAKRERQAWQRVDTLIGTKRPRDYDAAVTLLTDLRQVSGHKGRAGQFAQRISELREAHAMKPSLLARLSKTGL